jgi:hypothetical protein
MVTPAPWHFGQVWVMEKKPRLTETWPWPPQVAQVVTLEPGAAPVPLQVSHGAGLRTVISFSRRSHPLRFIE